MNKLNLFKSLEIEKKGQLVISGGSEWVKIPIYRNGRIVGYKVYENGAYRGYVEKIPGSEGTP